MADELTHSALQPIRFTVYGEPVAQGRPRMAVINGRPIAYDPKKSRDFKLNCKTIAQQFVPERLLTGAVKLRITVYRQPPKSMSKTKLQKALNGIIRPTTKPDLKNYIAGVEDAIEKVIYNNDSQVVELECYKYYGDPPRIEVTVIPLEEVDNAE